MFGSDPERFAGVGIESPMPEPFSQPAKVRVVIDGRAWNGHWRQDGGVVVVDSAYGSRSAAVGRKAPKDVASAALKDMVEAWQAKSTSPKVS
jgi:hypothetical protein